MKPGRNEPCPCKSGKKYKKCCYLKYSPPVQDLNDLEITGDEFPIIKRNFKKCEDMSKEEILELIDDHILFCGNEDSALEHLISVHGFSQKQIDWALEK